MCSVNDVCVLYMYVCACVYAFACLCAYICVCLSVHARVREWSAKWTEHESRGYKHTLPIRANLSVGTLLHLGLLVFIITPRGRGRQLYGRLPQAPSSTRGTCIGGGREMGRFTVHVCVRMYVCLCACSCLVCLCCVLCVCVCVCERFGTLHCFAIFQWSFRRYAMPTL